MSEEAKIERVIVIARIKKGDIEERKTITLEDIVSGSMMMEVENVEIADAHGNTTPMPTGKSNVVITLKMDKFKAHAGIHIVKGGKANNVNDTGRPKLAIGDATHEVPNKGERVCKLDSVQEGSGSRGGEECGVESTENNVPEALRVDGDSYSENDS